MASVLEAPSDFIARRHRSNGGDDSEVINAVRTEEYSGIVDAPGSIAGVPTMQATYPRASSSPAFAPVIDSSQAKVSSTTARDYSSPLRSTSPSKSIAYFLPTSLHSDSTTQPKPASFKALESAVERLLSPITELPPSQPRASPGRTLKEALRLAQEAVRLDSTGDPNGAVMAYAKSVALLSEVIEKTMREDSTGRNGKGRSVSSKEEELQRIKQVVSVIIVLTCYFCPNRASCFFHRSMTHIPIACTLSVWHIIFHFPPMTPSLDPSCISTERPQYLTPHTSTSPDCEYLCVDIQRAEQR